MVCAFLGTDVKIKRKLKCILKKKFFSGSWNTDKKKRAQCQTRQGIMGRHEVVQPNANTGVTTSYSNS